MPPLEHRFLDTSQVTFLAVQKADIIFPVPDDHWKHRFLELGFGPARWQTIR
jgi:hypothetical protein